MRLTLLRCCCSIAGRLIVGVVARGGSKADVLKGPRRQLRLVSISRLIGGALTHPRALVGAESGDSPPTQLTGRLVVGVVARHSKGDVLKEIRELCGTQARRVAISGQACDRGATGRERRAGAGLR